MPPEVREYEPALALYGGEDGLECYRRLVPEASGLIRPGGVLVLEVGADTGAAVLEMVRDSGFRSAELVADFAGKPRVVTGIRL